MVLVVTFDSNAGVLRGGVVTDGVRATAGGTGSRENSLVNGRRVTNVTGRRPHLATLITGQTLRGKIYGCHGTFRVIHNAPLSVSVRVVFGVVCWPCFLLLAPRTIIRRFRSRGKECRAKFRLPSPTGVRLHAGAIDLVSEVRILFRAETCIASVKDGFGGNEVWEVRRGARRPLYRKLSRQQAVKNA